MKHFKELQNASNTYLIVVITSKAEPDKLLATGSVVMERKFIRGLATLGHIEDITVAKETQGQGIGKKLIQALLEISASVGAYKTMLDCSEDRRGG